MHLSQARLLYDCGLLREQAVVDAAVEALQAGADSPSLRPHAGLGPRELDRAKALLESTAEELGLRREDDDVAAVLTGGTWMANEALHGRVTVARAVQWISYNTWYTYSESPVFEEVPADRPREVQERVNGMELADLFDYDDHLPAPRRVLLDERGLEYLRHVAAWTSAELDP
jgi:hypothetical protein